MDIPGTMAGTHDMEVVDPVGTLFIVACSEVSKALCWLIPGLGGLAISSQGAVKSLQSPILLRVTRLDTLRRDSQLDPPYRQSRESPKADAGKWKPLSVRIVQGRPYSLNTRRSARRTCGPLGHSSDTACQEVPGRRILDRQRVYAHAVSRAEPTLEIHAPHVVGIYGSVSGWLHGEVRLRL